MNITPDEMRIIALAAPIWIRMLLQREERLITKMYGEYRNGRTDFLPMMAELACVKEQLHEITTTLKMNEEKHE